MNRVKEPDNSGGPSHVRPDEGRTVRLLGELYAVNLAGLDTGGAFALIEQ